MRSRKSTRMPEARLHCDSENLLDLCRILKTATWFSRYRSGKTGLTLFYKSQVKARKDRDALKKEFDDVRMVYWAPIVRKRLQERSKERKCCRCGNR